MTTTALAAEHRRILDGEGGRPSPLAGIASELGLGTLLNEILTRIAAVEDEVGVGGALTVDTIAEETTAAGVTVDGAKLKDGVLLNDQFVVATITAAGGSGGATAGTFSIASKRADEATAFAKAVQMLVFATDTQYAGPFDPNTNVTFASATTGTIVASGSGWALIETNASGAFACALANSSDETVYFAAMSPIGYSDPTDHAQVISNSASAVWAA